MYLKIVLRLCKSFSIPWYNTGAQSLHPYIKFSTLYLIEYELIRYQWEYEFLEIIACVTVNCKNGKLVQKPILLASLTLLLLFK